MTKKDFKKSLKWKIFGIQTKVEWYDVKTKFKQLIRKITYSKLFQELICWLVFFLFKQQIIAQNIEKSMLLVDYLFYLMPLTFFTLFFGLFDNYLRACYSSVMGSFAKEFIC